MSIKVHYLTVAVTLVILASFVSFSDAAYSFGLHYNAECTDDSMIGWTQGFSGCSAEKKRGVSQTVPCYIHPTVKGLFYSYRECTIDNEAPTLQPPAGMQYITYSPTPNCEFSNSSNWAVMGVNATDTYLPLVIFGYGSGAYPINASISCQNGVMSVSACLGSPDACFSLDSIANNQCTNFTMPGADTGYSALQTTCQAPPVAPVAAPVDSPLSSPVSAPVAAPKSAQTPSTKKSSATIQIASLGFVLIGAVFGACL